MSISCTRELLQARKEEARRTPRLPVRASGRSGEEWVAEAQVVAPAAPRVAGVAVTDDLAAELELQWQQKQEQEQEQAKVEQQPKEKQQEQRNVRDGDQNGARAVVLSLLLRRFGPVVVGMHDHSNVYCFG